MHRTIQVLRRTWWSLLLAGLASGGLPNPSMAQQPMPSGTPYQNPPHFTLVAQGQPGKDPAAAPADQARDVVVGIGGIQRIQTTSKERIKNAVNERDQVATLRYVDNDPTALLVIGRQAGISMVTMTDVKGTVERFRVIVQLDLELLRTILRQAVPTASVEPIAGGGNTVILTGYVAHPQDIQVVLSIATGVVGGAQVVNALQVGGVQQVQLDVVVARVARSELRQMGFNYLYSGPDTIHTSTIGSLAGAFQIDRGGLVTPQIAQATQTNMAFGIIRPTSAFFGFLQALRTETLAKLLAEPKVVTMSGRPATFLAGGDQAVPEVSGFGGTAGVRFEPFGTRLTFLPIVMGNGKIYLEVQPEVSSLDNANGVQIPGGFVPGRVTQRVQTSVTMEPGQVFVIGGLIQTTTQASMSKVPVLGDLPFIGPAFSTKNFNEVEEELIVLVTPRLVDPSTCDQLPKWVPGQESRNPSDFELFLEGILEAPRGPREVFPNRTYRPAFKNGPTATLFPCAGNTPNWNHGKGLGLLSGACQTGCCTPATPAMHSVAPVAPAPAPLPTSQPGTEAMPMTAVPRQPIIPDHPLTAVVGGNEPTIVMPPVIAGSDVIPSGGAQPGDFPPMSPRPGDSGLPK